MTHLYAVMSTLPAGGGCTTAELSVTVLGEPPPSDAEITARSRVIYSDERNALAEGLVVDHGGQPVAHSTSRYFLFAPGAVVPSRSGGEPLPRAPSPEPGAMLREPAPQVVPVGPAQLQQLSGLEILAAQLEGKIAAAPIDQYAAIRLIEAEGGRVVSRCPRIRAWCRSWRRSSEVSSPCSPRALAGRRSRRSRPPAPDLPPWISR